MINSDRSHEDFIDKYESEYNFNFTDGLTLKPTASKEAIKELLVYRSRNKDFFSYKDILANHLVNEFKKTDCYTAKTEEERKEIIEYLLDPSNIEEREDVNYTDENGSDILI